MLWGLHKYHLRAGGLGKGGLPGGCWMLLIAESPASSRNENYYKVEGVLKALQLLLLILQIQVRCSLSGAPSWKGPLGPVPTSVRAHICSAVCRLAGLQGPQGKGWALPQCRA
jgi:hypothetical protein